MSAITEHLRDSVQSQAFDAVVAAPHASPDAGGPCATCAFRPGAEASRTAHTVALVKMCVEGVTPFDCHEHPRLCRGWIAAVNLQAPLSEDDESVRYRELMCAGAEVLAKCIAAAKADQDAHEARQ